MNAAAAARRPGRRASAFSALWLARRLRELIGSVRGAQLCVAYSGGADSTALLAALARLRARGGFKLRALHVNHQLHAQAGAMAGASLRRARALKVPCEVLVAPVRAPRGESVEAVARDTRYAALQARLQPGEWLVLAQHREDQLETVLLQLLRGAGVAGLAAMPAVAGTLLRPLLDVAPESLREYLRRAQLGWHEDSSNTDVRFDRNYLRLRVIPLIKARWPAAGTTVSRSAALAAEAQQLLESQADLVLGEAFDGAALQVTVLRRLKPAERRNALRRWLALQGLPLPDQRRLQEIAGPLLRARFDAQPQVTWTGVLVRRHRDLLHAFPVSAPALASVPAASLKPRLPQLWHWRRQPQLPLPDGSVLCLRRDPHGPLSIAALPSRFELKFRSGGERLAASHGEQTLKRLLQEQHWPPWQRAAVPLLYDAGRLVAVADWWSLPALCQAAAAGPRARLVWVPPDADPRADLRADLRQER